MNRGISPIVGTILLVGITVAVAAVVATVGVSRLYPLPNNEPFEIGTWYATTSYVNVVAFIELRAGFKENWQISENSTPSRWIVIRVA